MTNDFLYISYWWIMLFWLGIIFFPLTFLVFKKFFDLGYSFSKIIALLVLSYGVWILGSLKILSFSTINLWLLIIVFIVGNFILVKKYKNELFTELRNHWKILLFEEAVFFLTLAAWSFVRSHQPDIQGLEKFMDFGFINSILKSQYFPPADMWMAGKTINYYYFGHLVTAVLTKLSTLESAITYNLMMATVFALTFSSGLSIVGNLVSFANNKLKTILTAGIIAAALLTIGGNLHTLWWFLTHSLSMAGYWYPDATRFIVEKFGAADNTIHEFPIYSFVVSDLHGHVSDIPFVLLFLALLFSLLVYFKEKNQFLIPLALTLAVMYMTNSWDFPIYFLIAGLVILYFNYLKYGLVIQTVYKTAIFSFLIFIFSIVFSLPFHLNFSQIAKGLAPVDARTPFWQFFVLWGYQWTLGLVFTLFLLWKKIKDKNWQIKNNDAFVVILLIVATMLIIIPEFYYVKDIYIASYHRANTVFKLVYQSFMLYALAGGYIIIRIFLELHSRIKRSIFGILITIIFASVFTYSDQAISSYYGGLKTYRGLWGLSFMESSFPNDYAGIVWLKENVTGQPYILEAAGDSYTDYNRVSMITGLPTVEGWLVHEWLWRGSFDEPGKRSADVQTIYETEKSQTASQLLKKYDVKYVFVGSLERQKYKVLEDKFSEFGKIIFQSGNTRIYSLVQ